MAASVDPPSVNSKETETTGPVTPAPLKADAKLKSTNLDFYYGSFKALHGITLSVHGNRVTAFIGPSGCGKSTFLRT